MQIKTNQKNPKTRIEEQIIGYLSRRPDAKDTLRGIVEWWLLEQKLYTSQTEVKDALAGLVAGNLVNARASSCGTIYYSLNKKGDR